MSGQSQPGARSVLFSASGLIRAPTPTPTTIASPIRLDAELRRIRRSGVALDVEEAQPGMACLAAPVLGPEGTVVGCVALSLHPDEQRGRQTQLIAAARRAARETKQSIRR
ncbi:IclR family transcriptional regulator C-terminal domain-containing protein [Streptomyces sp. NPDC046727]|uniref:IclR family transcriptional regulator domain-containing protein n=1 Tax=Streptomyces sp. NPDC046727 TaxID=3155373 RepID=UPI0033C7C3E9